MFYAKWLSSKISLELQLNLLGEFMRNVYIVLATLFFISSLVATDVSSPIEDNLNTPTISLSK